MLTWRIRLDRIRRDPERGFTIVELAVGVGIFAAAMLLMTAMMATGLRGVLQGKQRSSATTESNAVLEQAHNLLYEDVGLWKDDHTLAADPQIVVQNGQRFYRTDDPCSQGASHLEPLQYATNVDPQNPQSHPYGEHSSTYTVGSTKMTRYIYVTGVDQTCPAPDGVIDYKRVLVRTQFANPAYSSGAVSNDVRAQTFISPQTPGAPGAPPQNSILPPLSGMAFAKATSTSVIVKTGHNACIDPSCKPDLLSAGFTQSKGTTTILGKAAVGCTGQSPSASSQTDPGGTSEIVHHTESTSADDDSQTGSPTAGPNSVTQSYIDAPPPGTSLDSYLVEPSLNSSVGCAASATSLPLTSGTSIMWGSTTFAADLTGLGLGVPTLNLLSGSGARTENSVTHTGTTPSTREVGFSATRNIISLRVLESTALGLGASKGLVNVGPSNLTATAKANATTPSSPPGLSVGVGVDIEIFDPAGQIPNADCSGRKPGDLYCKLHVDATDPSFTGQNVTVSVHMGADANSYPYSFETSVKLNPAKISNGTPTPGGKLYEAEYSPGTFTTRLILRVPGQQAGSFLPHADAQVKADLGQVLARGCYGLSSGVAGCL